MSIIVASIKTIIKETNQVLKHLSYIHYLISLNKDKVKTQALINPGSEINTITLVYILKVGFKIYSTDIIASKIEGSALETFNIVLASFQFKNCLKRAYFFKKNLFDG